MTQTINRNIVFVAGLHRSGTSLLHEVLRSHPDISGFENSPAWNYEDEGQYLQSVYETGGAFGGPGKFAFNPEAYMNESHPLATPENAERLFTEWSKYWDTSRGLLIEKSPPNIIRTRFLQALFPKSKFITILRHPIAISYATKKWSKTDIPSLIDHTLTAYECFTNDMPHLKTVLAIRYEDFILAPQSMMNKIYQFLSIDEVEIAQKVDQKVNEKYFKMWRKDLKRLIRPVFRDIPQDLENRANLIGYSLRSPEKLETVPWLSTPVESVTNPLEN